MQDEHTPFMHSRTREDLMRAFAGESQARNRYTFAAGSASKQEQEVISRLFRFTAEQERAHASLFYHAMQAMAGETVTVDGTYPVDLSPDLLQQLKSARHNEHQEWQHDYAAFGQNAEDEGFPLVAKLFRSVADVERVHGDRFGRYAKMLEEGSLYQAAQPTQWMCLHCGLVVDSTAAPAHCPLCRHPQGYFLRREEEPFR